jgi:hypothetical protein
MCSFDWVLALEYFKVVLSWPPITLLGLTIFFWRFEKPVHDLIDRVVEGSILGNTFKASSSLELQQKEAKGIEDPLAVKAAGVQGNSLAQPLDMTFAAHPELQNDPLAENAINYVQSHPIETVIEYKRLFFGFSCEKLFNCIFGTQVNALVFLEASGDKPQPLSSLVQFHTEHQNKIRSTEYQITEYINFLVIQGMVELVSDTASPQYKITPNGIKFLSYVRAAYPTSWNLRAY